MNSIEQKKHSDVVSLLRFKFVSVMLIVENILLFKLLIVISSYKIIISNYSCY